MSYTNKTPNYDLPQYIATDKPTYLGDFNQAMSTIDSTMKQNANSAESATTIANTATSTANQALTSATSAENSASQAGSTASQALTLATSANSKIENFNLTTFNILKSTDMTCTAPSSSPNINPVNSSITVATNAEGSLAKIYGEINLSNLGTSSSATDFSVSFQTNLRPETNIVINNTAICQILNPTEVSHYLTLVRDISIATNGLVTITGFNNQTTASRLKLLPILIFVKDFGDSLSN